MVTDQAPVCSNHSVVDEYFWYADMIIQHRSRSKSYIRQKNVKVSNNPALFSVEFQILWIGVDCDTAAATSAVTCIASSSPRTKLSGTRLSARAAGR